MPIYDNSNPDLEPGFDNPQFADGTHEISGIDGFFKSCQDDAGVPFYKPVNGVMKVMVNTKTDAGEGPPMSLTPAEMVGLAYAFGVDLKTLPTDRMSSKFLMAAKEAINKSGKKIKAEVGNNWVKNVPAAQPPTGLPGVFQVVFDKFYNIDGTEPPTFQKDKWDNIKVGSIYRIVADGNGIPTMWEGFEIKDPLYDPFDGVMEGDDGTYPKLAVAQNGARPIRVSRFYKFCEAFTDKQHLFEMHSWKPEELENPLLVVNQYLMPGGRLRVMLELTEGKNGAPKRLKFDLNLAEVVGDAVPVIEREMPTESVVMPAAEVFGSPDALPTLLAYLNKRSGIQMFDKENVLTVPGQAWAKENIVKAWAEVGLPDHRKFALLTPEEAEKLRLHLLRSEEPEF